MTALRTKKSSVFLRDTTHSIATELLSPLLPRRSHSRSQSRREGGGRMQGEQTAADEQKKGQYCR